MRNSNRERAIEDGRIARLGATIVRHPREFVGLLMASIATGWIFTNALFLQKGPHPAPFFAAPKHARPLAPQAANAMVPMPTAAPTRHAEPVRRNDPIAALLAPSPRMLAVQQALAVFAYGPVSPTGVYDLQTRAAIERFQRARGLPVDGQANERTLRELTKLTGSAFE